MISVATTGASRSSTPVQLSRSVQSQPVQLSRTTASQPVQLSRTVPSSRPSVPSQPASVPVSSPSAVPSAVSSPPAKTVSPPPVTSSPSGLSGARTAEQEFPELAAMYGTGTPEQKAAAAATKPAPTVWSPFTESVPEIVRKATVITPEVSRLAEAYTHVVSSTPGAQAQAQDIIAKTIASTGVPVSEIPRVIEQAGIAGKPITTAEAVSVAPAVEQIASRIAAEVPIQPPSAAAAPVSVSPSLPITSIEQVGAISAAPAPSPAKTPSGADALAAEFPELATMFGTGTPEQVKAAEAAKSSAEVWSPFKESIPDIVRKATVISPDIARLSEVWERTLAETPGSTIQAQDLIAKAVAYSGGNADYVPAVLWLSGLRGKQLTESDVVPRLSEIKQIARDIYKSEILDQYRLGAMAYKDVSSYLDQFSRPISKTPLDTPPVLSGYPETYDEFRLAAYVTARDAGLFSGNELALQAVAKYCPWSVPLILAGKYNENQVLGLAFTTAILAEGYQPGMWTDGMYRITGYADFPAGIPLLKYNSTTSKNIVAAMCRYAQIYNIDPLTLNEFLGHIKRADDTVGSHIVSDYISNPAQLREDSRLNALESAEARIRGGVSSGEYLMYVGGAFGVAGVAGALVLGGPVAALAALPITVFATTEFANLATSKVFAEKSISQEVNKYWPDLRNTDKQLISAARQSLTDFRSTYRDAPPEERLRMLESLDRAISDAETASGEHWYTYGTANEWQNRVSELVTLRKDYEYLKSLVASDGTLTGRAEGPATIKLVPSGYTGDYTIEGLPGRYGVQKGEQDIRIDQPGNYALVIKDNKGNVLKKTNVYVSEGDQQTITFTGLVGGYGAAPEGPAVLELYVPPGVTAKLGDKTYEGGSDGSSYKIEFNADTRGYIIAEGPGGVQKTNYFSVRPGETSTIYVAGGIQSTSTRQPTTVELVVPPYATLTVGGIRYEGGKTGMSYITQMNPGTTQTWVLTKPGFKAESGNLYVGNVAYQRLAPDTADAEYATITPNLLPGQEMYIDGQLVPASASGQEIKVLPGSHSVIIRTPGYDDYSTTANWYAGEKYAVGGVGKPERVSYAYSGGGGGYGGGGGGGYSARAPKQTLIIFGQTLKDAVIYLDGQQVTPEIGKSYSITPGYHTVLAMKKGYQDWSKSVYFGEGRTVEVNAEWVSGRSSLDSGTPGTPSEPVIPSGYSGVRFGSTLQGARIWLDGKEIAPEIGKLYTLSVGYHVIKASKSGYKDYEKSVYFGEKQAVEINVSWEVSTEQPGTSTPSPSDNLGHLVFGPACSGASLELDGVAASFTVGQAVDVYQGYHGIKLTKPGYKDWVKTVYVAAGDTYVIAPVFELSTEQPSSSQTKRVYLNSNPSNAKIIIDGGFSGKWTPAYADLPYGLHKVTFQASGYNEHSTYVWVGETVLWGDAALEMAKAMGVSI